MWPDISMERVFAVADTAGKPAYEIAHLYPPQGQWSEDDYFALPDRNSYVELSEGMIVLPPHPTPEHQRILFKLAARLQDYVQKHQLGEVLIAPVPVRLWPGKIREPDIFFFFREHADRIGRQFCGVPDLVIEILSPGTRKTDRTEKFYEYARAGVGEYWMVDMDAGTVELFVLHEGAYLLKTKAAFNSEITSSLVTGFKIKLAED